MQYQNAGQSGTKEHDLRPQKNIQHITKPFPFTRKFRLYMNLPILCLVTLVLPGIPRHYQWQRYKMFLMIGAALIWALACVLCPRECSGQGIYLNQRFGGVLPLLCLFCQ